MSLRQRLETLHLISPPSGWTGTVILVPAPTPPARTRVAVYSALLSAAATTVFNFADTAGNPISGSINLLADTPLELEQVANQDPWFLTGPALGLQLVVTSGGPVMGDIYYLIVPGDLP